MDKKIIYNQFERSTLQNIIDKYRNIIENKCTNSENVFRKQQTWISITNEYNSVPSTRKRLTKQLKRLHENLKARIKKKTCPNLNYTNNDDNNCADHNKHFVYNSSENIMDNRSTNGMINHSNNNTCMENFESAQQIFIEPNNYIVVDGDDDNNRQLEHQLTDAVPNTNNIKHNESNSQHEIPSSSSKSLLYSHPKRRRPSILVTMTSEDDKRRGLEEANDIDFTANGADETLINNEVIYQQSENTSIHYDKFLKPLISMKIKKIEESIEQQRDYHQLQMKREQLQIELFEIQLNNENNLHSQRLKQQNELHALRIKHEQAVQGQRLQFEQELHESKLNEYNRTQNVTSSSSSSAYPLMYK